MKIEWEKIPYASWLEESIHAIYGKNPVSMAVVARCEDGEVLTGYYDADATDKAIFAHNIQADVTLDVIMANIDKIRDALEEYDNG